MKTLVCSVEMWAQKGIRARHGARGHGRTEGQRARRALEGWVRTGMLMYVCAEISRLGTGDIRVRYKYIRVNQGTEQRQQRRKREETRARKTQDDTTRRERDELQRHDVPALLPPSESKSRTRGPSASASPPASFQRQRTLILDHPRTVQPSESHPSHPAQAHREIDRERVSRDAVNHYREGIRPVQHLLTEVRLLQVRVRAKRKRSPDRMPVGNSLRAMLRMRMMMMPMPLVLLQRRTVRVHTRPIPRSQLIRAAVVLLLLLLPREIRLRARRHTLWMRMRTARKRTPIRVRVRLREPPHIELLLRIPPLPLRVLLSLLLLLLSLLLLHTVPKLVLLLPVQLERILLRHRLGLLVLLLLSLRMRRRSRTLRWMLRLRRTEGDSDWGDRRARAALRKRRVLRKWWAAMPRLSLTLTLVLIAVQMVELLLHLQVGHCRVP